MPVEEPERRMHIAIGTTSAIGVVHVVLAVCDRGLMRSLRERVELTAAEGTAPHDVQVLGKLGGGEVVQTASNYVGPDLPPVGCVTSPLRAYFTLHNAACGMDVSVFVFKCCSRCIRHQPTPHIQARTRCSRRRRSCPYKAARASRETEARPAWGSLYSQLGGRKLYTRAAAAVLPLHFRVNDGASSFISAAACTTPFSVSTGDTLY